MIKIKKLKKYISILLILAISIDTIYGEQLNGIVQRLFEKEVDIEENTYVVEQVGEEKTTEDSIQIDENKKEDLILENENLEEDQEEIENLYIRGTVKLCGYHVKVTKNVYIEQGCLDIDSGLLEVQGNITVCENAYLKMSDESGVIQVEGDFTVADSQIKNVEMLYGKAYIGGNLIVEGKNGYYAEKSHETIFNGEKEQQLKLNVEGNNQLGTVDIIGGSQVKVICGSTYILAFKSEEVPQKIINPEMVLVDGLPLVAEAFENDYTIDRKLVLQKDVTFKGNLNIQADIDLNGHQLVVEEDVRFSKGQLNIHNGKLVVAKDLYTTENANIQMQNEEDYIEIGNSYYASGNQREGLEKGSISIGKDLIVGCVGGYVASSQHETAFYGGKTHKVQFVSDDRDENNIGILSIEEDNLVEISGTHIIIVDRLKEEKMVDLVSEKMRLKVGGHLCMPSEYSGDCTIDLPLVIDKNLIVNGNLYINADINLNGYEITVLGNIYQKNGTVWLNGGHLKTESDYYFTGYYRKIQAENEHDVLEVKGNFYEKEHSFLQNSNTIAFKEGKIIICGDIQQDKVKVYWQIGEKTRFILDGENDQILDLYNTVYVSNLEVSNRNERKVSLKHQLIIYNQLIHNGVEIEGGLTVCGQASYRLLADDTWQRKVLLCQTTFDKDIEINKEIKFYNNVIIDNAKVVCNKPVEVCAEITVQGNSELILNEKVEGKSQCITVKNNSKLFFNAAINNIDRISLEEMCELHVNENSKINVVKGKGKVTLSGILKCKSIEVSELTINRGGRLDNEANANIVVLNVNENIEIAQDIYVDKIIKSADVNIENPQRIRINDLKNYLDNKNDGYSAGRLTVREDTIINDSFKISSQLDIENNVTLTVEGNLEVAGNLVINGDSQLIVKGDLIQDNTIDFNALPGKGRLVVEGNFIYKKGITIFGEQSILEVKKECQIGEVTVQGNHPKIVCYDKVIILSNYYQYMDRLTLDAYGDVVVEEHNYDIPAVIRLCGETKQTIIMESEINHLNKVIMLSDTLF